MSGKKDQERLWKYAALNPSEISTSDSESSSDGYEYCEEHFIAAIGKQMAFSEKDKDAQRLAKHSDVNVKESAAASESDLHSSGTRTGVMQSNPPVYLGHRLALTDQCKLTSSERLGYGEKRKNYSSPSDESASKSRKLENSGASDEKKLLCQDPHTGESASSDCSKTSTHFQEPHRENPPSSQEQSKFEDKELNVGASTSREHFAKNLPFREKPSHSSEEDIKKLPSSGEDGNSGSASKKTDETSSSTDGNSGSASKKTDETSSSTDESNSANISLLGLCLSTMLMVVGHVNSPSSVPPRVRSRSVNFPVLNPDQQTVARDVGRILRRLSDEFTTQMTNRNHRRRTISLPVDYATPTCRSERDPSPPFSLK